jgi:hypothetical protein
MVVIGDGPSLKPSAESDAALLLSLLVKPVIEHATREAYVATDAMARQAARPHGLIDPACLDVEIPSRLLRAKKSILREYGS